MTEPDRVILFHGKPVPQLSQEQAMALARSDEWKAWTPAQRGAFQLYQGWLCMDFGAFHEGIEAALGRPVWTHEMAQPENLWAEYEGRAGAPSLEEIISLLGDKAIIVVTPETP